MKKTLLILVLISVACIPVLLPLFNNGFFQTDDADWLIIRFSAFYQSLRDGQFPVRWLGRLNNGYGYPVVNFAYPGFMYLTAPLHALFGLIVSIKIFIGATVIGSGVFTFLWLQKHVKWFASVVGACVYVYAPYHVFDLYTRGSLGELLALAVVPFVLWNIQRTSTVMTSIGIGLLLLSHNTLAVFFLPLIVIYGLLQRSRLFVVRSVALGFGLSAFFWLPALFELSYTRFRETIISDWSIYFADMSLFGWVCFFVIIGGAGLLGYLMYSHKKVKEWKTVGLFVVVGLSSLWLSSEYSRFLWPFIPSSLIQFPFRLVSLVLLSSAFLSAWIVDRIKEPILYGIGIGIIVLCIADGMTQVNSIEYTAHDEGYYSTNMSTTTVKDEYMPRWVVDIPQHLPGQKIEAPENVQIHTLYSQNHKVAFTIQSEERVSVTIHTVYFPGWKAFIDNREVPIITQNKTGRIQVSVPSGDHTVEVIFTRTPIRIFGETVSVISIIGCAVFIIMRLRRKK